VFNDAVVDLEIGLVGVACKFAPETFEIGVAEGAVSKQRVDGFEVSV